MVLCHFYKNDCYASVSILKLTHTPPRVAISPASITRVSEHKPSEHDESKGHGSCGHICVLKEAVNVNET